MLVASCSCAPHAIPGKPKGAGGSRGDWVSPIPSPDGREPDAWPWRPTWSSWTPSVILPSDGRRPGRGHFAYWTSQATGTKCPTRSAKAGISHRVASILWDRIWVPIHGGTTGLDADMAQCLALNPPSRSDLGWLALELMEFAWQRHCHAARFRGTHSVALGRASDSFCAVGP